MENLLGEVWKFIILLMCGFKRLHPFGGERPGGILMDSGLFPGCPSSFPASPRLLPGSSPELRGNLRLEAEDPRFLCVTGLVTQPLCVAFPGCSRLNSSFNPKSKEPEPFPVFPQ